MVTMPTRLLINSEGEARRPRPGDHWDIVLVRDDGWSLAAPAHLARAAYKLWQGYWVETINCIGMTYERATQQEEGEEMSNPDQRSLFTCPPDSYLHEKEELGARVWVPVFDTQEEMVKGTSPGCAGCEDRDHCSGPLEYVPKHKGEK